MTEWVSVKDRLPEVGGEYIVYDYINESVSHDYWQMFDGFGAPFDSFWIHYGDLVTHWMPLPPPPQE